MAWVFPLQLWVVGTEEYSTQVCYGNSKHHPRKLLEYTLSEKVRSRVTHHFLLILSPPG